MHFLLCYVYPSGVKIKIQVFLKMNGESQKKSSSSSALSWAQ